MDSASDSGSEGWGFESLLACQKTVARWAAVFCFMRIIRPEVRKMKRDSKIMTWVQALRGNPMVSDPAPIVTDPNGSYTGRPRDPYEKPIQDADDL